MFSYVKLSGGVSLTMVLADLTTLAGVVLSGLYAAGVDLDPKYLLAGLIINGGLARALRQRTYEPMQSKVESVVVSTQGAKQEELDRIVGSLESKAKPPGGVD